MVQFIIHSFIHHSFIIRSFIHHSFIHIEHLYRTSSRKPLRGAPHSSTAKNSSNSSLKVRKKCSFVYEIAQFSLMLWSTRKCSHGQLAITFSFLMYNVYVRILESIKTDVAQNGYSSGHWYLHNAMNL